MLLGESLKTHFRIACDPDDSFESIYNWINVMIPDRVVYITGTIFFDGIFYMGFHVE